MKEERQGKMQTNGKCMPTPLKSSIASTADMRADNRCDMESHPVLETPLKKSLVRAAADAAESRVNIADSKKLRGVLETPARKELMSRAVDFQSSNGKFLSYESHGPLSSLTVSVLKEKCKEVGIKYSGLRKADLVVALSSCFASDVTSVESHSNLTNLTVSELRGKCKVLNIDPRGLRKADLVLRLEEHMKPSRKSLITVDEENRRSSVVEGISTPIPPSRDLSSLTVSELRGKCKNLNIDHRGLRKADLVLRLEEHMGSSKTQSLPVVDEETESSLQIEHMSIDFRSMKVKELKAQCKARGLPYSGLKKDLFDRLEKYESD